MSANEIKIGDKVIVGWAHDQCSLTGTVHYIPVATGDCWHISADDGTGLYYFQQFEFIRRKP